jgi:hypothetical protein
MGTGSFLMVAELIMSGLRELEHRVFAGKTLAHSEQDVRKIAASDRVCES